jgi:hypothetical protein
MTASLGEWGIHGLGGRVHIRLGATGNGAGERLTAEFSAELSGPGRFNGSSTVDLAALELLRFHREMGALVAGRAAHATLGSLGDEIGLTLEAVGRPRPGAAARLSGFVGAGLSGAVSFNGVEVDHPALVSSYVALDGLAVELAGRALLPGGSLEQPSPVLTARARRVLRRACGAARRRPSD